MSGYPGLQLRGWTALGAKQRLVQALDQALVAERLGQETKGAGLQDSRTDFLVGEGGDKNDRRAMPLGKQAILQIRTVHAGHLDVGDQTSRVRGAIRPQILLGGTECFRRIPHRSNKPSRGLSNEPIIIDN